LRSRSWLTAQPGRRDRGHREFHRPHHVVVLVVEDVAVPHVARTCCRIERERVEAGYQVGLLAVLRREANEDTCDLAGRGNERVLPSTLGRRRRLRGSGQEIPRRTGVWKIDSVFHIRPYGGVIERQRRSVQTLPVGPEAFDVDILAILQLKLHE